MWTQTITIMGSAVNNVLQKIWNQVNETIPQSSLDRYSLAKLSLAELSLIQLIGYDW